MNNSQYIHWNKDVILKKDDCIILDFHHNNVGYVTLDLNYTGRHPDAPVYLNLYFAEIEDELQEDIDAYHGWISKGWIQQEYIHIDKLPYTLKLPRRYTFRYLRIQVIDTSPNYQLVLNNALLTSISSVKMTDASYQYTNDKSVNKIKEVSVRTLKNCMQDVFEDGPKRDRRLWLGDLRLQALSNYYSFQNNDLVKRCLYLFAGSTYPDGRISACVFIDDNMVEADEIYFFDYALFFVSTLYDYVNNTKDIDILDDLYDVAMKQIDLALRYVDDKGIVDLSDIDCFIDWQDKLDKQTSGQGVLIYCTRQALELSKITQDTYRCEYLDKILSKLIDASKTYLYDEKQGLFISGKDKQISTASQVWLILAQVFDNETNRKIIDHIESLDLPIDMVTPYMMHHFCEALIISGEREKAMTYILSYWGKMIKLGADTFWEVFNPDNPYESPYGGKIIHSYCHAWSCTPIYLFEKYYKN
ncbi:MAG: hypothetical protein LUG46_06540 [Erysipelotrichaceae bacterium]|nr:hypothetical protein [Erysipelotrichaceae bacterium]